MQGADNAEVDCIAADDVKVAFWDTLGVIDAVDSTDPCKKVVQEDYRKYITLERFEEAILNQEFGKLVDLSVERQKNQVPA